MIKTNFLFMVILTVLFLGSCTKRNIVPPFPITVSFNLGSHAYNCITGNLADCPLRLVELNYGKLKSTVTGIRTPQFSQTVLFEGSTYPNKSQILTQNNTGTHNSHKINSPDCCITLEIPQDDEFSLTFWYIEGPVVNGGGPCPGPGNNNCFRWFKSINIPKGTLKFSSFCDSEKNPFSLIVDQRDPSGFNGLCN